VNENPKTRTNSETPRRPWTRPTLTAYGPIGKLTQGASGTRNDGTSSKKASCL
jgi:hypothetical protein